MIRVAIVSAAMVLTGQVIAQSPPPPKSTLFYIPHTHWEGAVFKTREEYLDMGLPNILKALSLLKAHPEFKFTLDQVAYVKPFLERYPEEAPAFRKFVKEGRLGIVGGMDVMPDVVKPGGELFVRQMQYGKRTFHDLLGVDCKEAWLVDTFGHHPQMPQLLRQAGFESFWFCRGVASDDMPSEFLWRGIDGTQIPAFWIPGFYGLFYGPPRDPGGFGRFFTDRFNMLSRHTRSDERVGLAGVDVSEPEEWAPDLVTQYNRKPDRALNIRYSTPAEFAQAAARRTDRPVISAELSPIFQGTYSSRAELKQRTRHIEQLLLTAEKLDSIAGTLGVPTDRARIWQGWEPLLFNQTHDLASGVMTDHVYEDVQRAYDLSERLANDSIRNSWARITSRIDTRGPGVPVVVFNSLGWARTDVAEVEVGFGETGMSGVEVLDPANRALPAQLSLEERYPDGSLKRVRTVFVAPNVPAMGWSVYHVRGVRHRMANAERRDADTLENEHYRVTVDRATGAITSLVNKPDGWEALSGPANVVSRQEDRGDLWELYRGLDGASHIAMTTRQPVPTTATAVLSSSYPGKPGMVTAGAVYSEFSVSHPLDDSAYNTRIRLYNGIPRVDVETSLVNHKKFVRYQALFRSSVKSGKNTQEIPFGASERPEGIEFAAQHWVDWGDGKHGLALINTGMPGNLVTGGTLMMSLMRAHNLGGYGYGGGYEPGMSSESGFQLDRPMSFRYSLVPHAGDWREAGVFRRGLEVNHPLMSGKAPVHGGPLPPSWGLVSVSDPSVVLTAVNRGPDGRTLVRVYQATGQPAKGVRLEFSAVLVAVHDSDLMEGRKASRAPSGSVATFDLKPFEIKTLSMDLGPVGKLSGKQKQLAPRQQGGLRRRGFVHSNLEPWRHASTIRRANQGGALWRRRSRTRRITQA